MLTSGWNLVLILKKHFNSPTVNQSEEQCQNQNDPQGGLNEKCFSSVTLRLINFL